MAVAGPGWARRAGPHHRDWTTRRGHVARDRRGRRRSRALTNCRRRAMALWPLSHLEILREFVSALPPDRGDPLLVSGVGQPGFNCFAGSIELEPRGLVSPARKAGHAQHADPADEEDLRALALRVEDGPRDFPAIEDVLFGSRASKRILRLARQPCWHEPVRKARLGGDHGASARETGADPRATEAARTFCALLCTVGGQSSRSIRFLPFAGSSSVGRRLAGLHALLTKPFRLSLPAAFQPGQGSHSPGSCNKFPHISVRSRTIFAATFRCCGSSVPDSRERKSCRS